MMYKKFTENDNTIFYNIIDDLVNEYNNKTHSSIKMTPVQASLKVNEKKIKIIYNSDKTKKLGKFKIGDRVRLSLEKTFLKNLMRLIGQKRFLKYMILNTLMYHIII